VLQNWSWMIPMGMAEPLALVALLAAAAPLLLLPRLRRAARRARFPNVELARSACREAGRNRILANAWLLVARAAVVTLAALAVARPYVGDHPRTSGESAERRTVVALDRSGAWPSMDAFEEARGAAVDLLDPGQRAGPAALLPFDDLPGPVLESDGAARALRRMRPTGRVRSLATALDAAARVSSPGDSTSGSPPGTVFLITTPDAAREATASWPGPDGRRGTRLIAFVPEACAPVVSAVTIEDARIAAPPARSREEAHARFAVDVRLRRRGDGATEESLTLRLCIHDPSRGAPAPAAEVTVSAADFDSSGVCEKRIWAERPLPGTLLARVEVVQQGRVGWRFLLVPPGDDLRVLCLEAPEAGSAGCERLMRRALEALDGASESSGAVLAVKVSSAAARRVDAGSLTGFDAVAVGDVEAICADAWPEIERFVRSGGSLLGAAPGGLPAGARRILGIGGAVERITPAAGPGVALDAAAFGFPKGVRFRSRLKLAGLSTGETALAFEDGTPALVVRRLGRGRAGLFAAGLGELAGNPSTIVPLVDALMRRVALRPEAPLVLSPSDTPAVVELDANSAPLRLDLIAPDGRHADAILVDEPDASGTALAVIPCEGPGLWRLVARSGAAGDERTVRLIAVNPPVSSTAEPGPGIDDSTGIVRSRAELLALARGGGRVELGPVFAFLTLVALAAELALMEGRARARSEGPSMGGGK